MRGRLALAAVTAPVILIGIAACGGTHAAGTFHPAGAAPSGPVQSAALAARVTIAPGGYHFPAGISVDFAPAQSGSAVNRAILAGYQNYALSLWAAAASHGRDRAYLHQASGNALSFTRQEISYLAASGRELRGTIAYSGATVAAIYFKTGASVNACIDTSAFHVVNARTGAVTGPVFPARYSHYLENVTETKRQNGTWQVTGTQAFSASTSQGAICQ